VVLAVNIRDLVQEEKKAEEKIQQAEMQAAQLKKEAEETTHTMLQDYETNLDGFLKQETAPMEKAFQGKKAALERESTKKLEKIKEKAGKKHLSAVKFVVESVLGEEK
jgi:vacuolar-type H+-ATPase subunit H